MKKLFIFLSFTLMSLQSFAFQITSVQYNKLNSLLSVQLSYQGGCMEHNFSIEFDKNCDENQAVAGRISDSGLADVCSNLQGVGSVTSYLSNVGFNCSSKKLYLFWFPRRVPLEINLN